MFVSLPEGRLQVLPSNNLQILRVSKADEGVYRCEARVEARGEIDFRDIVVLVNGKSCSSHTNSLISEQLYKRTALHCHRLTSQPFTNSLNNTCQQRRSNKFWRNYEMKYHSTDRIRWVFSWYPWVEVTVFTCFICSWLDDFFRSNFTKLVSYSITLV